MKKTSKFDYAILTEEEAEPVTEAPVAPEPIKSWRFTQSILETKEFLIVNKATEEAYIPFVTNRSLSYHSDTILYAEEMNRRPGLRKLSQYTYLFHNVRQRTRPYRKWATPLRDNRDDVTAVMEYYHLSMKKAIIAVNALSLEQLAIIKKRVAKGGINEGFVSGSRQQGKASRPGQLSQGDGDADEDGG